MSDLLTRLSQGVLLADGAMGTMLFQAGLAPGACPELWNAERPEVLQGVHRAYFEAGADAVETNTFGCNLSNLGDYDIADRIRELSYKGTAIAGVPFDARQGVFPSQEGRIIEPGGPAVPGLYACGEMVGGLFHINYPGGSGLMSGAVFGRIAGAAAAGN